MGEDLRSARQRIADRLAMRARGWADADDHDPGIALLELLAFLGEALSGYQDAVAAEAGPLKPKRATAGTEVPAEGPAEGPAGGRFVGVRLQQGRVVLDADWNDRVSGGRFYGIYRGMVVDNVDPEQRRRLLVRVPDVSAQTLGWAQPALTVGPQPGLPAPGDAIWVLFEGGDLDLPVWLG